MLVNCNDGTLRRFPQSRQVDRRVLPHARRLTKESREVSLMPHHAIQLKRSDLSSSPQTTRQAESEAPPNCLDQMPGSSEWYVWHGQRIHYRVLGSGPPV